MRAYGNRSRRDVFEAIERCELKPLPALAWHTGQLIFRPVGGALLALALLFSACAPGSDPQSITAGELLDRLGTENAPIVLDVRSEGEYRAGHVPGAYNLEDRQVPYRIEELKQLVKQQSEALKQQVVGFLAKHPWATRKQLTAAVPLKTQAVYRRIMHELQAAGKIVGKGQKSKAVYALAGARKGGRRKKTKRA